ncbi:MULTISPECIES: hypothetical protein [Actinosynnema]|uniref:Secreted protein n=1 Tax=Actinosynnema pretiosum TaxID=42197 RepID=A0A290Z143_9PSEU|nr:hypothetical protein [Actinosynnema pretiosum]ATE52728.1 hypothetical protein CNX65_05035 [Actinosynnema pretiosum]
MNHTWARRVGAVIAALAAGLVSTAAPALAGEVPAGVAAVGVADYVVNGQTVTTGVLAPCSVEGVKVNASLLTVRTGVRFGPGSTTCTTTVVDPENYITTTKSEALGSQFELSALMDAGGPRLKIASWQLSCSATQEGTSAQWGISGLSGFTGLPSQLTANYTYDIKKNGNLLAKVIFGEVTTPPDGSITMNLMRVQFQPASGVTGEVVVGSTACSPTP